MATIARMARVTGDAPKVLGARVARLEGEVDELYASHSKLAGEVTEVKTSLTTVEANTAEILQALNTAKGIGAFVEKHFPRVMACLLGIAVGGGWINPDVAANIKVLLGLG